MEERMKSGSCHEHGGRPPSDSVPAPAFRELLPLADGVYAACWRQDRPSPADMRRLQPLLRAHRDVLDSLARAERLDSAALLRTFAPLLELVREMEDELPHRLELSRATLGEWCLEEVPSSVRLLSEQVRHVALESSVLKTLPSWLGHFQQLQTLSIAGEGDRLRCHLYNRVLDCLPESIGRLALRTLRLARLVRLDGLPDSLGDGKLAGSLQDLDIVACGLTALPDSISRLSRLERLSISDCWELKKLPEGIGELAALRVLNLEDLLELAYLPELGDLPLETVNIDCCELEHLPQSIGSLTSLQSLAICGCELLDLPNLERLTALRTLSLRVEGEDFARRQQRAGECRVFMSLARALPSLHAVTSVKKITHACVKAGSEIN